MKTFREFLNEDVQFVNKIVKELNKNSEFNYEHHPLTGFRINDKRFGQAYQTKTGIAIRYEPDNPFTKTFEKDLENLRITKGKIEYKDENYFPKTRLAIINK